MPRDVDSPAKAHPLPADDEAVLRFAGQLEAIWPDGAADPAARLGIAVSGGPDSCALLLVAHAALPGRVEAATVDHGLRAESAAEAAFVASLCESLGVPHRVCSVDVGKGNVQAQARAARYEALEHWAKECGLKAVATAHHADDQAETFLLRLNRGSCVSGLAGVRARAVVPGGEIVLLRPLLGWRRDELGKVVEKAGVAAVSDPSNLDDRFDRVRLRKVLAGAPWLDTAAIAQSASHLADADLALEWAARIEWDRCVRKEGLGIAYRPRAPRAIAMRVIARVVRELDGEEPRGGAIANVFDALLNGQAVSIGDLVARAGPGGWQFTKAPKRKHK